MLWHLFTLRRITTLVFIVNLILTCFTVYIFLEKGPRSSVPIPKPSQSVHVISGSVLVEDDSWNPWGSDLVDTDGQTQRPKGKAVDNQNNLNETVHVIEIWSKAAIGLYLWEHILRGHIDKKTEGDYYIYGFKKIKNYKFKFRSGPSVSPHSLRHFLTDSSNLQPKNLVIALNGRSDEKIKFAQTWLNEIKILVKKYPANIGVILLGNESCFNQWVKAYLEHNGGPIKFLYIVYDWKYVNDDDIYQWPLGVATYRNFPNPDPAKLDLEMHRQYACNFLGTVYKNSSREEIAKVMTSISEKYMNASVVSPPCFVKTRSDWMASETRDTLQVYLEALRFSDLTLSPMGMNHECYRIYEALSYGSIPVLEENLSHVSGSKSGCDHTSAYRLLKKYDAPVLYVGNWTRELPDIIAREVAYSTEFKVQRRLHAMNWYLSFKAKLRDHFLEVINRKFSFLAA